MALYTEKKFLNVSLYFLLYRAQICPNSTTDSYVGDRVMCPECDQYCPYWKLKKSCFLSKVAYVFDNHGTVAFSVMMSIWGKYSVKYKWQMM